MVMASQKKWGKRQESERVLRSDVAVVVAATGLQLLARQSGACTPPPGCGIQKSNIAVTSEEGLVEEKEFPWVVSLQDSQYTHLTFGTILSDFWILSIASTFQNRPVPLLWSRHSPLRRVGSGDSASCSAWGSLEGGFVVSGQHSFFFFFSPAQGLP